MIIVEIDYQFPTRLLLGEHRWGEFMKTPDKLEKSRVSQIFHSFYSSGRAVQKDGMWPALMPSGRHLHASRMASFGCPSSMVL